MIYLIYSETYLNAVDRHNDRAKHGYSDESDYSNSESDYSSDSSEDQRQKAGLRRWLAMKRR